MCRVVGRNGYPQVISLDLVPKEPVVIDVETLWKPPKCTLCKVFGHKYAKCPNASSVVEKNDRMSLRMFELKF